MTPPGTTLLSIGCSLSSGLTYSANYPGHESVVQSSTNLVDWQTIEKTRLPANGIIQKYTIDTTINPTCFFRLLVQVDRSPLITDPKLEDAIRNVLSLNNTALITEAKLAAITSLDLTSKGISTLEGIQHLRNLTSITLAGNPIIDYSQLLPTTTADLSSLTAMKSVLNPNNRDHFAETNAPYYIQANTVDPSLSGTLVKYVHPAYNGLIHTEGQWYAGFQLAEKGTSSSLTTEQQMLLTNIINGGQSYFPKLTINGQETTLQGWIKNDKTSAADADVFRITTLALAGRTAEANIASQDFFKYETKEIGGLTIPLCGVNDTTDKLFDSPFYTVKGNQTVFLWNPSYSYSYASNVLTNLDPKWSNLQRSQNLINSQILDKYGLIDWCVVSVNNDTGEISTSLDLDAHFPRTKVDSFHINQIFSRTFYANNWRSLNIYTEDTNGYLSYKSEATATIDSLLAALGPTTPENAITKKALNHLRFNSTQEFPGRGANINLTEQKEWPRFIMDHLMNYAKYNDASSLEMLNKIIEKHGIGLNLHPIYARYQALLAGSPILSPDDYIILSIGATINHDNPNKQPVYANGLLYYEWPNEIVYAIRTGLKATYNRLSSSDVSDFQLHVLSHPLGNNWYGDPWYDGKDWTFNQFIVGMVVNTSLQKIKLP